MGTLLLVKLIDNFEENGGWFGEVEFVVKALSTRMAWMEPFGTILFFQVATYIMIKRYKNWLASKPLPLWCSHHIY